MKKPGDNKKKRGGEVRIILEQLMVKIPCFLQHFARYLRNEHNRNTIPFLVKIFQYFLNHFCCFAWKLARQFLD